jgi:hypothetical protein
MVDNLKIIIPFLKFDDEDDFYYLQILQRKKENPQLGSNSRVIKNYYIGSIEYLDGKYDEIKTLCNVFNARASIRLNKRSYRKVAFKLLENVAHTMSNSDYIHVSNSYDRACGQSHNDKNKKWILDLDHTTELFYNEVEIERIKDLVRSVYSSYCFDGRDPILGLIPSKNGFHLITSPFNLMIANEKGLNIDIHKDNPVNLYIS